MTAETITFGCGCFNHYFVLAGGLSSALSCCPEHEAPNQTLAKLSQNFDFRIKRKYIPPPPPPTMNEQLMQIQRRFPDAVAYDKDGNLLDTLKKHKDGWFTVAFTMNLTEGKFNMDKVRVAFDVPPGFPCAHPKNFLTDPDLRLSYGGHIRNTTHGVHKAFGKPKRKWRTFEILPYNEPVNVQIVIGHVQQWSPRDTLFTYAMVIKHALEGRWLQTRGYTDAH